MHVFSIGVIKINVTYNLSYVLILFLNAISQICLRLKIQIILFPLLESAKKGDNKFGRYSTYFILNA